MDKFKEFLKFSFLYDLVFPVFQIVKTAQWYLNGKKTDTPHLIKQSVIREYGKKYGLRIFIETGTYLGMMVDAVKNSFQKIYTIELDENLYRNAKHKFAGCKHIEVIYGDSSKILPKLLKKIKKPCLFWLDAHFSKGITAKGSKNTPVAEELTSIFDHKRDHIILVDDAESFNGKNDYPSLSSLKKYILENYPNLKFEIKYNIMRITPRYSLQKDDK